MRQNYKGTFKMYNTPSSGTGVKKNSKLSNTQADKQKLMIKMD